jgi:hypothetical protein
LAALIVMRSELSSKATKMPGSLWMRAPFTSVCSAMIVLPEPGPPSNSVVRPRGKPPLVMSSNPSMPVQALGMLIGGGRLWFRSVLWFIRDRLLVDSCGLLFHRRSTSRTSVRQRRK